MEFYALIMDLFEEVEQTIQYTPLEDIIMIHWHAEPRMSFILCIACVQGQHMRYHNWTVRLENSVSQQQWENLVKDMNGFVDIMSRTLIVAPQRLLLNELGPSPRDMSMEHTSLEIENEMLQRDP